MFIAAHLRSVIDRVEVNEHEVRIIGRNATTERLILETGAAPSSVPSLVREWRAGEDETGHRYVIVSQI